MMTAMLLYSTLQDWKSGDQKTKQKQNYELQVSRLKNTIWCEEA